MKKSLLFGFCISVMLSCGKTELPIPTNNPNNTVSRVVELTGPIFVDGLPLLKRVDDSVNGITEYFYDESKREVRLTNSKLPIGETRYKYEGNKRIEANFTVNRNYVSPNPQVVLNSEPQFYEYDTQGRVMLRTSSVDKSFYEYSTNDKSIQESNKSLIASNPQVKPSGVYQFNTKGNLIEWRQSNQFFEYTYDDKINPNSFNPSSNSSTPGGLSKNNVLTAKSTGGWFGDSFITYKYTYNKYNLPVTATGDNGVVIKYTYYE